MADINCASMTVSSSVAVVVVVVVAVVADDDIGRDISVRVTEDELM